MAMLDDISSTEIAAWWGAIMASVVFLWDMYKWKTQGPKLVMRLSPNMLMYPDLPPYQPRFVSVTVSNIGDQPTTIKGFGVEYYADWFKRLRQRAHDRIAFAVGNQSHVEPLPKVLNPGEEWIGLIPHILYNEFHLEFYLAEKSRMGHVIIYLSTSGRKRSLRKRLTSIKNMAR